MLTLPQEIEVWYIIPAIRRELSIWLTRDARMSYEKVGQILGISKAAVSQYINGKRATKIKLHERAEEELRRNCQSLAERKSNSVKVITDVLRFIRKNKLHCERCGGMVDGKYHDCKEIKIPGL